MSEKLIIVGAGRQGEAIFQIVRHFGLYDVLGFAVSEGYPRPQNYLGLPVFNLESLRRDGAPVYVALEWNLLNADRRRLFGRCRELGLRFANIISPLAVLVNASVGENCLIDSFCYLRSGVTIGDDCVLMGNNTVGIDTVIDSHCFLAVQAVVLGGCRIGEQTFIGGNATICHGRTIGEKCIIGAGTTVRRDVPPFTRISLGDGSTVIRHYAADEIEGKLLAGVYPT